MIIQNPNLKIERTHLQHARTDKLEPICYPPFQCFGHIKVVVLLYQHTFDKNARMYVLAYFLLITKITFAFIKSNNAINIYNYNLNTSISFSIKLAIFST